MFTRLQTPGFKMAEEKANNEVEKKDPPQEKKEEEVKDDDLVKRILSVECNCHGNSAVGSDLVG